MSDEQKQIQEFIEYMQDPLRPFPFPENWLDLCSLCKVKAVSSIAQEHGEVAELYNNARPKNPFEYRVYSPWFANRTNHDCTWLGMRLQSKNDEKPYLICALDIVPLACECKVVQRTDAEKDAILARATPGRLAGDGDGARL